MFDDKEYHNRSETGAIKGKGAKKAKNERILLGLALSRRHCRPGVPVTLSHISAFTGTSMASIQYIEKAAIKKIRQRLENTKDPLLIDLRERIFHK